MGLVNCNTVGNLLNMVRSGRLNAKAMATHRFTFDQFEEAYDLFTHAAEHDVVKVVISRNPEVAALTAVSSYTATRGSSWCEESPREGFRRGYFQYARSISIVRSPGGRG